MAVIQVEDKVKQIKVGDYIGLDFGMVTQISDRDCLLYTSDAADERSSVDLGGRRIIKKKKERCSGVGR